MDATIIAALTIFTLAAWAHAQPATQPTTRPTFVDLPVMELGGIATFDTPEKGAFGRLWHDWQQHVDHQPGLGDGKHAYGVSLVGPKMMKDKRWSYLAALQITDRAKAPAWLLHLRIPAGQWAVFRLSKGMPDGLAEMGPMFDYIYGQWLPTSGYESHLPMSVERYNTTDNVIELLIPVRKKP